ncbi:hypothetical protein FRC07_002984 [Ceratobasidium sp. 392]|nr:hypothetical protein FRC07_002984 [Ceratobasidium sp. 392]
MNRFKPPLSQPTHHTTALTCRAQGIEAPAIPIDVPHPNIHLGPPPHIHKAHRVIIPTNLPPRAAPPRIPLDLAQLPVAHPRPPPAHPREMDTLPTTVDALVRKAPAVQQNHVPARGTSSTGVKHAPDTVNVLNILSRLQEVKGNR